MTEQEDLSQNGGDGDWSMSTKIDDMEERIDIHDEDIQELQEDLEDQLDLLDSR